MEADRNRDQAEGDVSAPEAWHRITPPEGAANPVPATSRLRLEGSFGLVRPADASGDVDSGSARNRRSSGEGLADEARRARTRRNPRVIVRPRRIEDAADVGAGRGELDQKCLKSQTRMIIGIGMPRSTRRIDSISC